ncbi:MAG: universal stress protein [Planctomycetales bacterium]|nr:universal stress protein [Planctomycetales bacterium]
MGSYFASKRILVPFDFSDQATSAFGEALKIADDTTELFMINVVVPIRDFALEPGMVVDLGNDDVRMKQSLDKMTETFASRSPNIHFEVRLGSPGHEITDYAKEIAADLIVMPSHGRSGLSRVLIGSVAERVIRHAECPVLILRQKSQ